MSRRWLDSLFGTQADDSRMTRRELMEAGLAAAAGLLISASESRSNQQQGRGKKVMVVGAGFAGLACAFELISAGCEVLVLEASDRVGGRVHSLSDLVPGKFAETGGEFFGANHPAVMSYAAKFQLELFDILHHSAKNPSATVLNGRALSAAELKATRPDVERSLDQLTEASRPVVADEPWRTPNAAALDALSSGEWIKSLEIPPLAKELIAAQLTANNGAPAEAQSQLGNLSQIRGGGLERYWTHSERYRCRGGNDQFAKKLAEGIKNERIQLNTAVSEISTSDKLVRVTAASGKMYEADEVALCVPPTTWSKIRFSPNLPETLRPQMGQAVKFLTSVRDRFWERRDMKPSSMSYTGTGHTWLGTGNQNPPDPREVLISFISGPAAQKWSKHPAQTRIPDYQTELESLQPGFRESLEKTIFVDWLSTPWIGGGYSFPAPGQITTQGPIMHEGIGRLHFAGEHTCYQFVGYMEGGLHSGVDAAKRILQLTRQP